MKLWLPLDPWSVQGQAGQRLEHPGIVEGVPALGRGWNKAVAEGPTVSEGDRDQSRINPAVIRRRTNGKQAEPGASNKPAVEL